MRQKCRDIFVACGGRDDEEAPAMRSGAPLEREARSGSRVRSSSSASTAARRSSFGHRYLSIAIVDSIESIPPRLR